MSNERVIEDFLMEDYSQTALYSSFRSIASYIDGLKPSSRKVIFTAKKRNIHKPVKVSRFAADVSSETEYLHGEGSLQSVIVNLAQNFVGSNNDNLLHPEGSFGTRFSPIAAAPRYIFTRKSESFDKYFNKDDDDILISQDFEGNEIEPRFFVPVIPLLFINGSEGIGTGFAQKILPRNIEEIRKYIDYRLNGKTSKMSLKPFYRGFNGKIYPGEGTLSWVLEGNVEIKNKTTLEVTELPIGYTLSSYIKVLNDLSEKKIIKDYEDLSENESFHFVISVTRDFTNNSEDRIYDILKLRKRVTENLTCVDENNSIIEFDSVEEILDSYIELRLNYYTKRKELLLSKYKKEKNLLDSKAHFIKSVIEESIIVSNRPKNNILDQIEANDYPFIKVSDDNPYDYLLNLPIYSLSKERYEDLIRLAKEKSSQIEILEKKTEKELWKEDL